LKIKKRKNKTSLGRITNNYSKRYRNKIFIPEPPLGDVVVCGDEERLPGPRDEDLLEENLGHIERGDDGGQPSKLQHQVQVLAHCATRLLTGNSIVF
jgi:hypothetical protein